MRKVEGHTELNKVEARQASAKPPTQYVLGWSLSAVIAGFVAVGLYFWWA